jgi:hypothetical protein
MRHLLSQLASTRQTNGSFEFGATGSKVRLYAAYNSNNNSKKGCGTRQQTTTHTVNLEREFDGAKLQRLVHLKGMFILSAIARTSKTLCSSGWNQITYVSALSQLHIPIS